jgi:hypothetical protein
MTPQELYTIGYRILSDSGFRFRRKSPLTSIYEKLTSEKPIPEGLLRLGIHELNSLCAQAKFRLQTAAQKLPEVGKELEDCQRKIGSIRQPVSVKKRSLREGARALSTCKRELENQKVINSHDQHSLQTLHRALSQLLDQ